MSLIIGQGGPGDRADLPLATRRGRHISNERRIESPPARLRAAVELINKNWPSAKLRSATSVYNCMGLIFASRRTWIDPGFLIDILADDEYIKLAGIQEVQIGDVVIYRDRGDNSISHIGIVLKKDPVISTASWNIIIISQWGADGEYIHPIQEVPYYLGDPVEYWTDRRCKL